MKTRFTAFCLTLILMSQLSAAQPLVRQYLSVESLVAPAEYVAIGRIHSVEEKIIVAPGGVDRAGRRHERGLIQYEITPAFQETLKQVGNKDSKKEFSSFQTLDLRLGKNPRLGELAKNKAEGLWLIYPMAPSGKYRRWDFMPFEYRGVNEFGYLVSALKPPLFDRDLSILRTQQEILTRLRSYGRISQMEHDPKRISVVRIMIPGDLLDGIQSRGFNELSLPIDSNTVRIARKLIEKPGSFLPEVTTDPFSTDMLVEAGIQLLAGRKTKTHLELLKECLDSTKQPFSNCRNRIQLRAKAYEKLLNWRCELAEPEFAKQVRDMNLTDFDINDETMLQVAALENLETLNLWGASVTHLGIAHLAGLDRLKQLHMNDLAITDEMLKALEENDQLYRISQMTTADDASRPRSVKEVENIKFWCAPFTDSGLQRLGVFENLTHIDLGRMEITDDSIPLFAKFRKLKFAVLHETKISTAGAIRLKSLLPNCKVEVRDSKNEIP